MDVAELVRGVLGAPPGSPEFASYSRALGQEAFSRSKQRAELATKAIFAEIVEPWADSFLPDACTQYIHFMSEVLYAPGSTVSEELEELGYPTPESLRSRYRRLLEKSAPGLTFDDEEREEVKRVIFLSRVTLGADIAVVGTVLGCARWAFPNADLVLLGPRKNIRLVAGGHWSVKRVELAYNRGGSLKQRLSAWRRVRAKLQQLTEDLPPKRWLVVDPDSRLSQLGLLPVTSDDYYCFWESRSEDPNDPTPIGIYAGVWSKFLWGMWEWKENSYPWVSLDWRDGRKIEMIMNRRRPLAAVSFGYGGRESKRLGDRFEDEVLETLRAKGYRIVIDCGAGEEEEDLVKRRITAFKGSARPLADSNWPPRNKLADLMYFKGTLLGFGSFANGADVFVGYDSAAAHMAAALNVPVIDIFVGARSDLMRQRWTPTGELPVWVIPANGPEDREQVLGRLTDSLAALEQYRKELSG